MGCNCGKTNASDLTLLESIFDKYLDETGSGNMITILQRAQKVYGYLPKDVIFRIAERTGQSPAQVIGVATFYTQFRTEPIGKYFILLCKGTACHVNGADSIERAICERLGIEDRQTTDDGLFSLQNVACLGCCSLSPVMMINNDIHGSMTVDKAIKLINEISKKERMEREGREEKVAGA